MRPGIGRTPEEFCRQRPPQLTEEEPPSEQRQGKKARTSKNTKLIRRDKKAPGNRPQFDLSSELHRISGVDLTRIDSINVLVAQTVISEVGLDMSRWNTEAHFASWLGLCPDNRVSGDKVLSKGTRHVVNRAAMALRIAATTLLRSRTYLGAQYRRLRTRLGAPKAITAMAHKLARLVYRMLKFGQEYVDKGMQYYEERNRLQQLEQLKKKAAKLGLQIVQAHPA
jgi:transposase